MLTSVATVAQRLRAVEGVSPDDALLALELGERQLAAAAQPFDDISGSGCFRDADRETWGRPFREARLQLGRLHGLAHPVEVQADASPPGATAPVRDRILFALRQRAPALVACVQGQPFQPWTHVFRLRDGHPWDHHGFSVSGLDEQQRMAATRAEDCVALILDGVEYPGAYDEEIPLEIRPAGRSAAYAVVMRQSLSREQVFNALEGVNDALRSCGGYGATLELTISGGTGAARARVEGLAGTAVERCCQTALADVRFPLFLDDHLTIRWPM